MATKQRAGIKVPVGVSGKQRVAFLDLTEEQKVVYRHHFDVVGRPAAICYLIATGQLDVN